MGAAEQLPIVDAEVIAFPEQDALHETWMVISDNPESAYWKAAEEVEAAVFMERDYVTSAEELSAEYAPYVSRSRMVALVEDGQVIGATRIINYALGTGFKTLNDAAKGQLTISEHGTSVLNACNPNETIEVGTIALLPGYRSQDGAAEDYATRLYGAIWALSDQRTEQHPNGTHNLIASFDADYYNGFSQFFGDSVQALGPPTMYMGSETVVAALNTEAAIAHFKNTGQEAIVEILLESGNHIAHER